MKTKISLSTSFKPISLSLMLISITSCTSGSGSSNKQMNSANVGSQASQTSCFTLTNAASATTGSQWWITTTATLKNTCSQSLVGTVISISNAKQAMNGGGFNLNTINPYSAGNAVSFSYPNNTVVATITGGSIIEAGSVAIVSFGGVAGTASAPDANSFVTTIGTLPTPEPSPTPTPLPIPSPQPQPTAVPTTPPIPTGAVVFSGDVFYHLPCVPLSSSAGLKVGNGDDLNLSGGRYTDLISLGKFLAACRESIIIFG